MQVTTARPYAWPFDGTIDPARTAFLVFTGDTEQDAPEQLIERLGTVAAELKAKGVTIVSLPHLGSIAPAYLEANFVVQRPRNGAFCGSDIALVLQNAGLTHLLLAGVPFELGADCTMREANDLGYECLLLEDLCTGLADETLRGAISSVTMSGGIFGAVAASADVLAALATN